MRQTQSSYKQPNRLICSPIQPLSVGQRPRNRTVVESNGDHIDLPLRYLVENIKAASTARIEKRVTTAPQGTSRSQHLSTAETTNKDFAIGAEEIVPLDRVPERLLRLSQG